MDVEATTDNTDLNGRPATPALVPIRQEVVRFYPKFCATEGLSRFGVYDLNRVDRFWVASSLRSCPMLAHGSLLSPLRRHTIRDVQRQMGVLPTTTRSRSPVLALSSHRRRAY